MYTRGVAEFAAGIRLEDIPTEVVERAKAITLDGLGCGLYAAKLPWIEILTRVIARGEPGGGPATLWGRLESVSPASAALINGTAVQGFEIDDIHIGGGLHSAAAVVPSALAASEYAGNMNGRRVLAGIIAGFEVGPRVGMCMRNQQMLLRGWHSGAIVTTFPAALAAGVVMGLNAAQFMHALGIAATQSAGLMSAQYGSMVKRMHHGKSAQSGLYAALLAAEGFTGIEDVFELPYGGFCRTFSNGPDNFDLDQLIDGLGTRWETMRIAMKPYATMGGNHAAIDAIKELQQEADFGPDDVEEVVVEVVESMVHHAGWAYQPKGVTAAQMNLGFAVAMQLTEGDVFVEQMVEENIARPDLMALTDRVKVVRSVKREKKGTPYRWGCDMTARLKDGRVLTKTVDWALGSEKRPLSNAQIREKYRRLARTALPEDKVATVESEISGLESRLSPAALMAALRP
jgi:2-methylcitrate dehydratase PrpD